MHKLGLTDASFLYFETASTPMNIASVQLLEVKTDGFFEELLAYLEARVHVVPFMTRRLEPTPFALDAPVWVCDREFDIRRHVLRLTLPPPGTQRQLESMVARLHETPFERTHPMWRFHYIEGLRSGHVAWYCKYHHACIDGMAGQAIIDLLFSPDPAADPPATPKPAPEPDPGIAELLLDATRGWITQSLSIGSRLDAQARAVGKLAERWLRGEAGLGALMGSAPRTRFNVAVSRYRTWAAASLPLPEMKAVAKSRRVTLNDVLMTVCGGGMTRYLARKNELPDKPLRAGVPVSLRAPGDATMRNQVTMLVASLASDVADPLQRLAAVKASMDIGKGVVRDSQCFDFGELHVPGLAAVGFGTARLLERLRIANYVNPVVNVVISNVRGPSAPVFLHGARMCSHYPVSIPAHGVAMNFTVQSYADRLDLGVTACLEAVPDVADLRDDVLAAWVELRDAWRETLRAPTVSKSTLRTSSQAA